MVLGRVATAQYSIMTCVQPTSRSPRSIICSRACLHTGRSGLSASDNRTNTLVSTRNVIAPHRRKGVLDAAFHWVWKRRILLDLRTTPAPPVSGGFPPYPEKKQQCLTLHESAMGHRQANSRVHLGR